MIRKACDVKLNVLPLLTGIDHLFYYEGPCRFGKGEALEPGFDKLASEQTYTQFMANLNKYADCGMNILEPVRLRRTDDWENSEAQWEAISDAAKTADVVVAYTNIGSDDLVLEFADRFDTPIIITPMSLFSQTIIVAGVTAKEKKHEVYAFHRWEDLEAKLKTLRARKVIRTTSILGATRLNSNTSYSSVDSFANHALITERLGVKFRYVNVHELIDDMSPAKPEGNYTTPGRTNTPNINDEDMAEINAMADELLAGADEVEVDRQYLINSLKAYKVVHKLMDFKDCCGFTVPCPDACSTRRLNQEKFTFCLTHSLNMEQGIPSACEYDVSAVLSQQALIAVSDHFPYMGNTCPVAFTPEGKTAYRFETSDETLEKLCANPEGLYMMQHSVAHRRISDPNKVSKYAVRHFAYDQGFGAVIRHDFDEDEGKTITVCRFTPDGSKLFIGRGTVVAGGGYYANNCNNLVYFRVADLDDFYAKQCLAGNHLSMVCGDYTEQLIALAESLGIEPVVSR